MFKYTFIYQIKKPPKREAFCLERPRQDFFHFVQSFRINDAQVKPGFHLCQNIKIKKAPNLVGMMLCDLH